MHDIEEMTRMAMFILRTDMYEGRIYKPSWGYVYNK